MRFAVAFSLVVLAGCNTGPKATKDDAPKTVAPAQPAPTASTTEAALRIGAPIEANVPKVALADVAKSPAQYENKTFMTTGTVTAVCQHMGCWMEIKDDASAAHIKMAGHKFFVPKTASGRKAKVLATLVKGEDESCQGEGHEGMTAQGGGGAEKKGCRAEAEDQLGRPLAKLELVADGVELL